jgi:hypothetical protein
MVATELALVAYPTPETLVVVDLWFIEKQMRKGTLDYREKAPLAATKICFRC